MSFAWGALAGCIAAMIVSTLAAPYLVVPGWNTAQARRLPQVWPAAGRGEPFRSGGAQRRFGDCRGHAGRGVLGLYQLAFDISSWPVITISLAVHRSARRRLLTKTIVERCASTRLRSSG